LGQLCAYIDLNPVRAGIVSAERVADHRYSSYWYQSQPRQRPKELVFSAALAAIGGLSDTRAGWDCYADYLKWQATEGPAGKNAAYASLSSGWALGSDEFKEALIRDHNLVADSRAWEREGAKAVNEQHWANALQNACERVPQIMRQSRSKSAPWKVAIAAYLKATTDVSNPWLATQLDMGSPFYVSKHVGRLKLGIHGDAQRLFWRLEVKGKA